MTRYRGINKHRKVHPKIYVFSHTQKTELEYFQEYKNYLKSHLLIPSKKIFGDPAKLLNYLITWKAKNVNYLDGDEVWAVFDIDDFYSTDLLKSIEKVHKSGIKIAFSNECFELWILLHFLKPSTPISRKDLLNKIRKNLKSFQKGKNIFNLIINKQSIAIKHAQQLLKTPYDKINWEKALSKDGNPSTSLHLLAEHINSKLSLEK